MRIENWERAMMAEIAIWRARKFAWGSADCLHLCLACGVAITGAPVFADLPNYSTELGAARGLKKLGFASVADMVSGTLVEKPVRMAARGDWVMIGTEGLVPGAFGVVIGRQSAHMSESGLVFCEALDAQRAWGLV